MNTRILSTAAATVLAHRIRYHSRHGLCACYPDLHRMLAFARRGRPDRSEDGMTVVVRRKTPALVS